MLKVPPSRLVAFHLDEIAKKAHDLGLPKIALKIFQLMSENHVFLSKPFSSNSDADEPTHPSMEVRLLSDHWNIENIWEEYLQPNLSVLADDVLEVIINTFEERYDTIDAWKHGKVVFDSDSYRRSSIKPHEQDKYPSAIDVLIDAARITIDYKLKEQSGDSHLLKNLIYKKSYILKRLAIYAITECSNHTSTAKVLWALENTDIHESFIKHEIFELMKHAYPSLEAKVRQMVIDKILSFKWFEQNNDSETHEAYYHFEWFGYLYAACNDCSLLKNELNKLEKKYPQFKQSEHPDLSHWSSSAEWVGHASPWSAEELLASRSEDSYENIISFEGGDAFRSPDRAGLLMTITEAAKEDPRWGFGFAEFLSNKELWNQDVWKSLISAWEECPEEDIDILFSWLERQCLYESFCGNIASLLQKVFQSKAELLTERLVLRCNQIALNLWPHAVSEWEIPSLGDWMSGALNHPAGKLALYWMESLSVWNKLHKEEAITKDYKKALNVMFEEDSVAGGYARAIICSQFSFLFSLDAAWVHGNITPTFNGKDVDKFQQSWSGFLTWGRLYPSIITELSAAFVNAATRLEVDMPESEHRRFIEFYVLCLNHAGNVIKKWIPALLNNVGEENKERFASQIRYLLQGLDEEIFKKVWGGWLKTYWENRLLGVPNALVLKEINGMIEWPPHTKDAFPEAIELVKKMPVGEIGHTSVVYMLKDSPLVSEYPNSMADFLIYLLKSRILSYHGIERVLQQLLDKITDSKIKDNLIEQLELKGTEIDTAGSPSEY